MKLNKLFLLILLFAILIRVAVIFTEYQNINSDNGILGLMAKHILKGEFPIFFYGQPYMGSPEAFVIAFFFIFFGISTKAISLAMTFITSLGIISAYFLGKELKDRTLGIYAMLFSCIPPAYFFWHGLAAFGGYPEMFLYGNLLFFFTLKIINTENQLKNFHSHKDTKTQNFLYFFFVPLCLSGNYFINSYTVKKAKYYMLLGLIAGLAFWTHLLIIYYFAPVVIFLFINEKKKFLFFKAPFFFLPSFILGGLPFWIYNLKHNFESFDFPPSKNLSSGLVDLFYTIPKLLSGPLPGWIFYIVLFIYVFSFLFLIAKTKKPKTPISPNFIFFLLFASIVYFFSSSPLARSRCARYIIPLVTVVMISTCYLAWYLNKKARYLGFIPLIFVLSFNGTSIYKSYIIDKAESYADHIEMTQLMDFLSRNKLYTNYCSFWISEKLNFLSNEKIINAIHDGEKYLPYEDILEESDNIAAIELDTSSEPMLGMLCKNYSKSQISQLYIYYNFQPKDYYGQMIPSKNWQAKSNYNNKDTAYAFTRNADTYWGTIIPKTKGMFFSLDLGKTYIIYKIAMFNSSHWRNFPLHMSIRLSTDGKEWNKLDLPKNPEALFLSGPRLYWHLQDGRIELIFNPVKARYIKISQNGRDSINPWEINEIFVWEYKGEREFISNDTYEIYNFLVKKGINNTYADFYISAKINKLSNGKIKTLRHINKQYPHRENTKRLIDITEKTAFIIDNENVNEISQIFSALNIIPEKEVFKNYTCFYFEKQEPLPEYLYWSGYGILRTNMFKTLTAKNKKEIIFKGNIKFLGYNLEISNRNIRIDYFWHLTKLYKGIFNQKIFVFVYFMKDNKIIFQNDHPLLEQFPFAERMTAKEIYKESYTIKNVPQGTYDIMIGLYTVPGQNRIRIISAKARKSKELIGKITIQ